MTLWPDRPVPVFPLPSVVLFPRVPLPLHVFELRYRTMVRDALSAGRHLAIALLRAGWERDYHGSPEFHPVLCLATLAEVEWLPNDCYDLTVRGVARARVRRVEREFPYRAARLDPLPEHPFDPEDPLARMERQALIDSMASPARGAASAPATDTLGLEELTNLLATFSPIPADAKQRLLEQDSVLERARSLREELARRRAPSEEEGGSGPFAAG